MAEFVAAFAPDQIPEIQYSRVSTSQAAHIEQAMTLPEHQANFHVSFLPVDTPAERQAAAEEWAGYKQAQGQIEARERGAFLVVDGRDQSPQAFINIIEGKKDEDREIVIPFAPWVTHSVIKIIKLHPDAKFYNLFRGYYEPEETSTN